MKETKLLEDKIRTSYNEYECSKILLQEIRVQCSSQAQEREKQYLQKGEALVGLYKERCRLLEMRIEELEGGKND